jgi:hypothetical protein
MDLMTSALEKPGVYVHWGVYGSGKTVAAFEISRRLQAEGRTVVFLNGYDWQCRHPREWLWKFIGIPNAAEPISAFMKRGTIVIDDFSPLMKMEGTLELLGELVTDSMSTGGFNVMLCVTSWEWATEILKLRWGDWRPKLIGYPGCGMWEREHVEQMAEGIYMDASHEAVRASLRSKTPIFPPGQDRRFYLGRAETLDLEWRKGIQALLLLPADSFTVAHACQPHADAPLGPGTFPDKDGFFKLSQ